MTSKGSSPIYRGLARANALAAELRHLLHKGVAMSNELALLLSDGSGVETPPPAVGGFIEDPLAAETVARARLTQTEIDAFMPSTAGPLMFPSPYNTEGWRLTDATMGVVTPHDYAYWRVTNNHVNSNEMKIMVRLEEANGGPSIITLNKLTSEISAPEPIFDVGQQFRNPTAFGNAYFSGTDPNKIFWAYEGGFNYVDVSTLPLQNSDVVEVFSADTISPGYKLFQSSSANDDSVHEMTYLDGSYNALGAVVINGDGSQYQTFPAIGDYDEAQVDKSGDWLVIKENVDAAEGEDNRVFDLSGGLAAAPATEKVINDLQGAGGHSDLGYGHMVAADNYTAVDANTFRLWDLSDDPIPNTGVVVYNNEDWNVQAPNHVSWAHAVPASTTPIADQYVVGSGANSTTSIHANEIIAIPLDESYGCLVIAPCLTDPDSGAGSFAYNRYPKGCTDITGEYFIWSGNQDGSSRIDLFLVRIPSQLLTG